MTRRFVNLNRTIKNLAFGICGTLLLLALVIWGLGRLGNVLFQSGAHRRHRFSVNRRNCLRLFRSVIGLLLTSAMFVPIVARIHAEEHFLVLEFGAQYRAYQQHTRWRLLPFVY